MYTVICFHDSHNPSRGWWSPCLADTCICELCHRLLGLCTFRLPLNLQLLTVPSESCVFSRNQRHSFIHMWSILFMFELNITIMWVELLCKINIQDIPSSTREAFYLCLNWTSPSCEWNCCARSTYKIFLHPHVKHFIYVWTEHHHHVSGTVVQDQRTRSKYEISLWDWNCWFEIKIAVKRLELLKQGHHHYSVVFICFVFEYFMVPCGQLESPYLGKAQQPQEQRYPFLSVCEVFSRV